MSRLIPLVAIRSPSVLKLEIDKPDDDVGDLGHEGVLTMSVRKEQLRADEVYQYFKEVG